MGGNVSREMSVTEGDLQNSIPRSSTLPAGLRGLLSGGGGAESHGFSVKLTKSKKLEGSPSKKGLDDTKVEIVASEQEEDDEKEEITDEEETLISFVESLLSKVIEDTIESAIKNKMKKSSTLPATFRGISKNIQPELRIFIFFFRFRKTQPKS